MVDPLEDPHHAEHAGVQLLREARTQLRAGRPADAVELAARAAAGGLPAEAAPHGCAIRAVALMLCERAEEAAALLRPCWRDHPDVAVLPALLGASLLLQGSPDAAAAAMFAGFLCDDPDASLELHRPLLALLFERVGSAT